MDPELPSAVKELIRRLEGRAEPLRWLPTLSWPDFQEFFPERKWLHLGIHSRSRQRGRFSDKMQRRERSEVRRRVLEAIGSCNTFHSLDVKIIFGGDISRLWDFEWELLLAGFRRSTVLRAIRVEGLRWRSRAEMESLCLELGRVLRTSSVKDLTIVNCRLSARCFLNLASGLRGNDESQLESLELRNAWEDSSAVKHMADMILSATRLQTLEIGGSGGRLYDMDEEATRTLSQALIKSSSLKNLVLKEVKDETSAFLLKALHADDGNRTIECLHLVSVSGLGDCLQEVLRSNPCLKELTLSDIDMRPEKWRQLGKAIREDSTARTIHVTHFMHHRDNLKEVEELACAASSDIEDPTVELKITFYDYDAFISALDFVGRVLRGKVKSLKSLILFLVCPCPSGSNHDRMKSIVPMDGNPGETSVLKRLRLFVKSIDTLKGVWKYLLCSLRENTSVTHLDLSDSGLDDEAFGELMGFLQVNLTLQQIDVSGTSWAEDGKAALIQQALRENQNRACYMSVFREANLTFGVAKAGRLFLCGSPRAGKTTLRQTLMSIVQGPSWKRYLKEFLRKDDKSQISIWDFARQEIFHTLQHVIFPQTSSFCIFQFVYSPICEILSHKWDIKPHSCFERELEEWMRFITSNTRVIGHNLPQVLVVMSHKDKVKDYSFTRANTIVDQVSKKFENSVKLNQEWFHVNARNKDQVDRVKNHIFHTFEEFLREKSPRVPHLCSELTSLLVTKTKKHKKCPIWSSKKFLDFCAPILERYIPTYFAPSFDHSRITISILSYLNDVGSIIYIPNLDYIIVDLNWLINTFVAELIALGQLFQPQASESSDETSSYTSKYGFISESVFDRLIEDFLRKHPHAQRGVDREMLKNILINLDFCYKLEDTSQYCIPSFIFEHASMEEQEYEEGAHESMYGHNTDDTSQVVGIQIQCQDGEDEDKKVNDGQEPRESMPRFSFSSFSFKNLSQLAQINYDFLDDGKIEEEDGKSEEYDRSSSSSSFSLSNITFPNTEHASMEEQKPEEGGHESMYWYNRDENSQFFGIRIQCQDGTRMSLTAVFFLRFQMFMRRKLISEMDVSKEAVTCSPHYLQLFLDGHQIYVQQGRNHKYVDVLMLCSKHKSSELARKYVMKHIVEELISFCASPKGCPGVALVLGVIQTLCVEMLNPSHLRGAILIEKLKSDFIRSINHKLEEMPLERSHLVKKEELFNYEHCWPPYEKHQDGISERARDLLWQSDVEAVVNCIRQKQIHNFESLQEGLNSVDNDLAQSNPEGENMISDSDLPEMKDYKPSTSKSFSQESTSVENCSTRIVLRLEIQILDMEMQSLEMMEMKIGETLSLQRLEMMEMKIRQILSLQREYLTREQTIEAAGVSIISDAAELATRGKDSEDEEPGLLPSTVKDLIRRLEGRAEPLRCLPTLTSPDLREFFPEHALLSYMEGWQREVRLRVLEAIGSCNTFHSLDVKIIFGGDISRLTDSEWELLLRGFWRSPVLRAIRVEGLIWRSRAEVESLCLELGRILRTSSVKDLTIVNCRMSATCFLNLSSGLRGNDESQLESLELRHAWEDSSAVWHMADMIISATRLETLEIGGSRGRMYDMDENAARILSQALIKSSSLKKLVLNEVKGEASAFLLKAFDADDGNRAIECLDIISVSGLGDCLRDLLRSNPYLKEVDLTDIHMRPEELRQLRQLVQAKRKDALPQQTFG